MDFVRVCLLDDFVVGAIQMTSALPALIQREGAGKGLGHVPFPAIIPRGRASSRNPVNHTVGNVTYAFKADSSPAKLDAGSGELRSDPAFLVIAQTHNATHSNSPTHQLAPVSMEKSVSCVSHKEFGAFSASDIEEARKIHERLLVRMMIAPGDSKGAMYRCEAAFGLSFHCQQNLRYQNRASGEFIARLHAAWRSVLEQSVARDIAELLRTEAAE